MSEPEKPIYIVEPVLKDGILTTGRGTPHVWAPYQPSTGRVDHDFEQYDDQLNPLIEGWVWKKFNLVPADE